MAENGQYIVPQFITVEDKILGPITVRQFVILLVAFGFIFLFYKLFDFSLFLLTSIPLAAIALVLAFVNINGKPFHYFLLNFFLTLKRSRISVWQGNAKRIYNLDYSKKEKNENQTVVRVKNFDMAKVEELSKTLDTQGKYKK